MPRFVNRKSVDLIDKLLDSCDTQTDQGKGAYWLLMQEKKSVIESAEVMTLRDATSLVLADALEEWRPTYA
jgi:hypothetical protein